MVSDFRQNIINQPRLRLGLILYSGESPLPWAITTTYIYGGRQRDTIICLAFRLGNKVGMYIVYELHTGVKTHFTHNNYIGRMECA